MKLPFEAGISIKTILPFSINFRFLEPISAEQHAEENVEIKFSFNKDCYKIDANSYSATLTCTAYCKNHFSATVEMMAIFTINEGANKYEINDICRYNIYAIILPHLRSLMTSITSYPGIPPVIVPAINVSEMVNFIDNDRSSKEDKKAMDEFAKLSKKEVSQVVVDLIEETFIKPSKWLPIYDFNRFCKHIYIMMTGKYPSEQIMYDEWPNKLDKLIDEACLEAGVDTQQLYWATTQKMEDGCWYGTFYNAKQDDPPKWEIEEY